MKKNLKIFLILSMLAQIAILAHFSKNINNKTTLACSSCGGGGGKN